MVNFDTFFSAQIRGIGGIPQQALYIVSHETCGNEIPCLLDWFLLSFETLNFHAVCFIIRGLEGDFCPFGASLYSSLQARYFCSLVVQGIASVLVYFLGWGHRGNAPVKLCIVAFNYPKL